MKLRSLKTRIGVCIAILMTIVVAILSGIAYYEFKEGLWGSMDLTLQSDLQQVKSMLMLSSETVSEVEAQRELLAFLNSQSTFEAFEYQIWREDDATGGDEISITLDLYDEFIQQKILPPRLNDYALLNLNHEDKSYRAVWARYPMTQSNRVVNIALAISSQYAYHEAGEFIRVLIIAGCIVVWAAWGLTQQILRWGLKPIDSLAEQMSIISQVNLGKTKQEYPTPHLELVPFVTAWEDMLARLANAMEEQKRFTSDAAHELKTPIALIKSTLQLAHSKKREAEYYENTIAHTLEDVDRLNNLVSQLLELSRIENVDSISEWERFNIKEVFEEVLEYYKLFLEEKGFCLKSQLCFAEINGNRQQIWRLLGNLMDNAIKYAPPKTAITVSLEADEKSVRISVHDEGGSIPEEDCSHLFDRFYRVSKARDRNSGGSGLGLAIAKEIVTLHSGEIRVESNRQMGTRFIVTLPGTESYRQS